MLEIGHMRGLATSLCFSFLLAVPAFAAPPAPRQAVTPELIRLHDDLHLSEAQETAWTQYVRAIAPNPASQARHRAAEELMPSVPTPRRIALMEAAMADDTADFRRQGAAVVAFYNQLTPEQQRTFDRDTVPNAQAGGDGGGSGALLREPPDGRRP
jgi:hypothetical protein